MRERRVGIGGWAGGRHSAPAGRGARPHPSPGGEGALCAGGWVGGMSEAAAEEGLEVARGMRAWLAAHAAARPGFAALKRRYDAAALAADRRAAAEEEEKLAAARTADADGWTLVVNRKGRKKSGGEGAVGGAKVRTRGCMRFGARIPALRAHLAVRGGLAAQRVASLAAALARADVLAAAHTAQVSGVSAAAAAALAPKASKATKGLSNFYTFQAREKRRSELLTLREKFAEDKRKMARMKMQRKGLGAGGAPL